MRYRLTAYGLGALAAIAVAALVPAPAQAFFDFFDRGTAECGYVEPHVIHRTVRRKLVYRPGVYVLARAPGTYGWQKMRVRTPSGQIAWRWRRILLRPYANITKYYRPRQRWVREREKIVVAAPPSPRGAWPDNACY